MNILDFGAKRGEFCGDAIQRAIDAAAVQRSEEHTSELQSPA